MKDFAQYLTTISYDEALHQVRQLSYDGDAKWEALFENDDAQNLLEKMAAETANEVDWES